MTLAERRPSRAALAYDQLRARILAQDYPPGEMLSEHAVAARLGVSRTPVRQALAALERDGLVRIVPNRGALVVGFSIQELRDMLEFREAIELYALSRKPVLAAEALQKLRVIFATLGPTAADERTSGILSEASEELHSRIVHSTGNQMIIETFERLRPRLVALRARLWIAPEDSRAGFRQHCDLIDAIAAGSFDEAGAVLRSHLQRSIERLTLVTTASPNRRREIPSPTGLVSRWLDDRSLSAAALRELLQSDWSPVR